MRSFLAFLSVVCVSASLLILNRIWRATQKEVRYVVISVKPVALERFWPDDLQIWSGPSSNIILARFWRKKCLGDFFCLIGWLISAHQAQKWDLAERKRHGIMYMLLEVFGASRNPKHDVQMYYGSFGSFKHDYKHQNHNFRIAHDQFWSKIISKNQLPVGENQSPVS